MTSVRSAYVSKYVRVVCCENRDWRIENGGCCAQRGEHTLPSVEFTIEACSQSFRGTGKSSKMVRNCAGAGQNKPFKST